MKTQNCNSEKIKIRLTLDVSYDLNGENAVEVVKNLRMLWERGIEDGMLTGEMDAEVEDYSVKAEVLPEAMSEDDLADFMLQRIENGEVLAEDIPLRLARYGLMEPAAFVIEMRERMEMANVRWEG